MRTIFFLSFLSLTFPSALFAEDLLPAICQQVLEPEAGQSIPQLILSHVMGKVKEIPSKIVVDAREAVDGAATSLADKLESYKSGGVIGAEDEGNVLGTSTSMAGEPSLLDSIKDDALAVAAFLLRHWLATLAVVGAIAIALLLRF
jgi:hypothetical protein